MDNPYQHGQQPHGIDMLAVYGGAKEFSGENFSFDPSQIPPLGQPLLSGSEQNLIADFFTHPDDFSSGKHVAFGYYEDSSANAGGAGSIVDHVHPMQQQQHTSAVHDGGFAYNNSNNFHNNITSPNPRKRQSYSADDINSMATYSQQAMSQNDVAAATTLSGFRNNASHDGFTLDGASWGAMSMTGMQQNASTGFGSDRQWLHNSAPRHGNGAPPQRAANVNSVEAAVGGMQRTSYGPPRTSSGQGRPFVAFGSDTNFANGAFAGATPDHSQKVGNLLGLPLAPQAAGVPPHGNHSVYRPALHEDLEPRPRQDNGQQFAPQYSTAWNGTVGDSQLGPNKRRKSNSTASVKVEQDEHDDEAHEDSKRRKSIADSFQPRPPGIYSHQYPMHPPQVPYAHGPVMLPVQDMRRGPPRKKENLTDDQKRANHIISEKKRREIINQGYRDLNELTPALAMGKSGLSRSECLMEINNYLYTLQLANARIIKDLQLDPSSFAIPAAASQTSGY